MSTIGKIKKSKVFNL